VTQSAASGEGEKTGPGRPFQEEQFHAIQGLGDDTDVTEEDQKAVDQFVGALYEQKMKGMDINHLRYRLFCQKRSETENTKRKKGSISMLHLEAGLGSQTMHPFS
jgi:hypothetical protein